jgi:hypothetical protein
VDISKELSKKCKHETKAQGGKKAQIETKKPTDKVKEVMNNCYSTNVVALSLAGSKYEVRIAMQTFYGSKHSIFLSATMSQRVSIYFGLP